MKKLILFMAGGVGLGLLALALIACGGNATASSTPAPIASSSPTAATATVTTLAGKAGSKGVANGTGSAARLDDPGAIALDAVGNLFVADLYAIRKVAPAGVVTSVAGKGGVKGSANGTGAAARFDNLCGIARDAAGNLYVSDCNNHTIRKITPAGVVTTVAGLATNSGRADGTGSAASFNNPGGICCDAAGDLYVADTGNYTIRKITSAGVVTTVAGAATYEGHNDGIGAAAGFSYPYGIVVDAAGNLYIADTNNNTIRKITFPK